MWLLVLFETALLLLLLRGLGELRERIIASNTRVQPFTDRGLALGIQAPAFVALDHEGHPIRLEDSQGQWRILAFVSLGCPACAGAIQALNVLHQSKQGVVILVVGGPDSKLNHAYAVEHEALMPILTPTADFDRSLYLVQGLPFIFVLDEGGVIRAKGVVNQLEDLQALLSNALVPVVISR